MNARCLLTTAASILVFVVICETTWIKKGGRSPELRGKKTDKNNSPLQLSRADRSVSNIHMSKRSSSESSRSSRSRRLSRPRGLPSSSAYCRNIVRMAMSSYYSQSRAVSNKDLEHLGVGGASLEKCNYLMNYLKEKKEENCQYASMIMKRCEVIARLNQPKSTGCPVKELPIDICGKSVQVNCDAVANFRTIDGSCNNLKNPEWGKAGSMQSRSVTNAYDDGRSTPRVRSTCTGKDLPSARVVSNAIHAAGVSMELEPHFSYMIMQMGQFLSHDFILTKTFTMDDESPLDCCGNETLCSECFPIQVPAGDSMNISCLAMSRSKAAIDCKRIRQQLNGHSSYLDMSLSYGMNEEAAKDLRTFSGGLLNTTNANLPADEGDSTCHLEGEFDPILNYCPESGDPRVNENVGLASMHTIFHRAHNNFANGLAKINPDWDDEMLYQNARKILIGVWQNIVYGEYLPLIIGQPAMKYHKIDVTNNGFKDTYNEKTDATTINEGGIAFRFGHSTVSRLIVLQDEDYSLSMPPEPLEDHYFLTKLYHIFNGRGHEDVLRWTVDSACPKMDRMLEPSVQQKLFQDKSDKASDIAALNIQRGRDHGLPGYNAYRRQCGLTPARDFSTARGGLVDMDSDVAALLQKVYSCPDDIDLFTAIVTERRSNGAIVGPLGQCIIADMFKRFRDGDRFFFERNDPLIGFTEAQLNAIKKIRMSSLICNTTRTSTMQENAFLFNTSKKPCSEFPVLDFGLWKQT